MILAAALVLGCLVRDDPEAVDAWLRRQGMAPVATAYSERFERRTTLWRGGERYAVVLPDRGQACVVDMGRRWQKIGR